MGKNDMKPWEAVMMTVALVVGYLLGGMQVEPVYRSEIKGDENITNPRFEDQDFMEAGKNVVWDCVWFGSYPQTEIVDEFNTCGIRGKWYPGSDIHFEEDAAIYRILQCIPGWDSNGDITIDGIRYRRIKKSDATYETSGEDRYYDWGGSDIYHYFRYDPIKWRVLDREGSTALLLADIVLDDRQYNVTDDSVSWETSTIRKWLNGYGSTSNKQDVDYSSKNFIDTAFTPAQQAGILTSNPVDTDRKQDRKKEGKIICDKIFLLSESDICTDAAKSYGFVSSSAVFDEARKCNYSIYAKAMGTYSAGSSGAGPCYWWLRSPDDKTDRAPGVLYDGSVCLSGYTVNSRYFGVRPALRLDLASPDLYSYAGEVSSYDQR